MFAIVAAWAALSVPLTPQGPWQVSPEGIGCLASRSYGLTKEATVFLQHDMSKQSIEIAISASSKLLPAGIGQIKLVLRPGGQDMTASFRTDPIGGDGTSISRIFLDASSFKELQSANQVELGDVGLALYLSALPRAVAAIETCNAEILKSWGVNPDLYTFGRLAVPLNPGRWFSHESYPSDAKKRHVSGKVVALLQTNPNGTLDSCKVVISVDPILDQATCAIAMEKVRVRPPLDGGGRPLASYALLPVLWAK